MIGKWESINDLNKHSQAEYMSSTSSKNSRKVQGVFFKSLMKFFLLSSFQVRVVKMRCLCGQIAGPFISPKIG